MVKHSRLSRSILTIKVKTINAPVLIRLSRRNQLRIIRELCMQVLEVIDVILILVELIVPRLIIRLTLPLLGGWAFTNDGTAQVLVKSGKVKFQTLKSSDVIGRDDNVSVLVAVLPLIKGNGGKLLFDVCFAVGVYAKDFVPIISLNISLRSSNCSKGESEEGKDGGPHCDG